MLDDGVVLHEEAPTYSNLTVEAPCETSVDDLLKFHDRPTQDWSELELAMMEVVHNEEGVCEEAKWYARLNTRIWDNYVWFQDVRYKLEGTDRNEKGQFSRTYKVIERVIVDLLEDQDIWTPQTAGKLEHQQQNWYRKMNDDHRGLDYYDQAWSEDKMLTPSDVECHTDSIQFLCDNHSLSDGDYISVPLLGTGTHMCSVAGGWLTIPIEPISEEEADEITDLLVNTDFYLVTMKANRSSCIDARESVYDGETEDASAAWMEITIEKLDKELAA
jgi:hypothetical protein